MYNSIMNITVNGNTMEVAGGLTVGGLLKVLELSDMRVAVEHNRRILQREEYAGAEIKDGDSLEILSFVGGG
jgi:sulfur carrier protein